jgi:hypothetical protein
MKGGSLNVMRSSLREQRSRALPVHVEDRQRADRCEPPVIRFTLFPFEVGVPCREPSPRVGGRSDLREQPLDRLARSEGENFGRVGNGNVRGEARAPADNGRREREKNGDRQKRPRDRGTQLPRVARGSHHLGRGGLPRVERGLERIAPGQRRDHRVNRSGAALRIFLEARRDDPLNGRIHVSRLACETLGARRSPPRGEIARATFEETFASEDLVEDQTEGVEIRSLGDLSSFDLLGRHVRRRPGDLVAIFEIDGEGGEAEVGDPRFPPAVDHDVGGLQVAMHDAEPVRSGQPGADVARDVERFVVRKAADPAEQRREILSIDVLHGDEVMPVGFRDVVEPADVRMGDLPPEPHLGVEEPERIAPRCQLVRQKFERHRLPELQVLGAEYLTHPATAERRDDPVAVGQNRSRREARLVTLRGRRIAPQLRRSRRDLFPGSGTVRAWGGVLHGSDDHNRWER